MATPRTRGGGSKRHQKRGRGGGNGGRRHRGTRGGGCKCPNCGGGMPKGTEGKHFYLLDGNKVWKCVGKITKAAAAAKEKAEKLAAEGATAPVVKPWPCLVCDHINTGNRSHCQECREKKGSWKCSSKHHGHHVNTASDQRCTKQYYPSGQWQSTTCKHTRPTV